MKKEILLLTLMSLFCVAGCGEGQSSSIISSSSEESSSVSSVPSSSSIKWEEIQYVDNLLWFPDLKIEVDQVQFIENYLCEFENSEILIRDESYLSLSRKKSGGVEYHYLTGLKEGDTFIAFHADGKYQKVNVNIAPKGTYKRAYTFESIKDELSGKKCANFGDSISANWTTEPKSVYCRRFADGYNMVMDQDDNHAIGGSVSMYVTNFPNVMEEYGGGEFQYNDGADLFYKYKKNNTLKDYDLIFLTFGYNDLYFQPVIDDPRDTEYCVDGTFSCCHSWKGCFRYMINTARSVNSKVKIVIQNIIYNEYDIDHNGYTHNPSYHFDAGIKYQDFRQALYEIGYEMDVKVIDMWNFTKSKYDYSKDRDETKTWVYKDIMHPSVYGNKLIYNYLRMW